MTGGLGKAKILLFVDVVVTEVLCNTVIKMIKMIRLLVSIVIIFSAHSVRATA